MSDEDSDEEVSNLEVNALLLLQSTATLINKIKPKQSYHYLCLDSYNAVFSPDRSKIEWLINDGNPVLQHSYINLCRSLKNIVAMRLGRISWSSMDVNNTNILNGIPPIFYSPLEGYTLGEHIGIGFSEFVSQSMIFPSGPRMHFIQYNCDDMRTGNTITTSGFYENRGWFRFRKPFTKLDTLTASIYNMKDMTNIIIPDVYLSIPAVQWIDIYFINPVRSLINIGPLFYMIPATYPYYFNRPAYSHPLSVYGELFQFSGFTTNDPIADAALIARYNSIHTIPEFFDISLYMIPVVDFGYPLLYPPVDISGASLNPMQQVPITITFLYKPRMIAALELITEDID